LNPKDLKEYLNLLIDPRYSFKSSIKQIKSVALAYSPVYKTISCSYSYRICFTCKSSSDEAFKELENSIRKMFYSNLKEKFADCVIQLDDQEKLGGYFTFVYIIRLLIKEKISALNKMKFISKKKNI